MRRRRRSRGTGPLGLIILLVPIILGIIVGIQLFKSESHVEYEVDTRGITNILSVEKDGSLINTLTDNRVEDYHENTEYEAYISNLVEEFNSLHGSDSVTVKSIKTDKEKTTAVIRFADYTAFSGFTGYSVFYGTLEDAKASGIDLGVSLNAAGSDRGTDAGITAVDIKNPEKTHIFVTNVLAGEGLVVESFGNIKYLYNASSIGKKLAAPDEDATAYIVW